MQNRAVHLYLHLDTASLRDHLSSALPGYPSAVVCAVGLSQINWGLTSWPVTLYLCQLPTNCAVFHSSPHLCVVIAFLSVEQPTCHHHGTFRRLGWATGTYPPQRYTKSGQVCHGSWGCASTALPNPLTHVFPSGGGVLGSCETSCLRGEPSPESRYSKLGSRSWVDKSKDLFDFSFMHSGSFLHMLFSECFSSFANTVRSNRCQNIGKVTWCSKAYLSNTWLQVVFLNIAEAGRHKWNWATVHIYLKAYLLEMQNILHWILGRIFKWSLALFSELCWAAH